MKITRREAFEILELRETASQDEIRVAYRRQSLLWHPDKHPEHKRAEATARFQRVTAAHKFLTETQGRGHYGSSYHDEYDYDSDEEMSAELADLLFRMFGAGFFSERPPGGVPPFFYSEYYGYSDEEYSDEYYTESDEYEDEWETESEEDYETESDESDWDSEEEEDSEEEKERHEKLWMSQLPVCKAKATSVDSITVDVDSKRPSRMRNFRAGQIPDGCYWNLEYRSVSSATWLGLSITNSMQCCVPGLDPGTEYVFRARPGMDGSSRMGPWNDERTFKTASGLAGSEDNEQQQQQPSNKKNKGKSAGGQGAVPPSAAKAPPPPPPRQTDAEIAEKKRQQSWLQPLPQCRFNNVTESSVEVSVDKKKASRLKNFEGHQLPDNYYWQVTYRKYGMNNPWMCLSVASGMQCCVPGLDSATEYEFKARPCVKKGINGLVEKGNWSDMTICMTKAVQSKSEPAKRENAAPPPPPPPTPAAVPSQNNGHAGASNGPTAVPGKHAARNRARRERQKAAKQAQNA